VSVIGIDNSSKALGVARKNAHALGAAVTFTHGNLLAGFAARANVIVANLPYIDKKWTVSAEIAYEPRVALYAEDGGLALIKKLIAQASDVLHPNGFVILEADPRQHAAIISGADNHFLKVVKSEGFTLLFQAAE
jgi:release factor glutamine methyltransferase